MDALLLSLIAWLSHHTEYDTRVSLPNIVITEPANLCVSYGITDLGTCTATKLQGFYDKKLTIYLHSEFDHRDPSDQSKLVHELVHYLQWHNHSHQDNCWAHLEVEAYNLQDEWREQHEISGFTDPFKLIMLEAACDA